jgi:hypothetical protein
MAQFTPFEIGQIKAHAYHGMSGAAISRILVKPESTSGRLRRKSWSEQAVQDAMKKLQDFPQWRGERDEGSGRPGMPASSSIISCLPWLPASIPLLTLNPRKLAILLSCPSLLVCLLRGRGRGRGRGRRRVPAERQGIVEEYTPIVRHMSPGHSPRQVRQFCCLALE